MMEKCTTCINPRLQLIVSAFSAPPHYFFSVMTIFQTFSEFLRPELVKKPVAPSDAYNPVQTPC